MSEQLAYPLTWPQGWPRTPRQEREIGQFDGTMDRIRLELIREIDRLVLGKRSTAFTIRNSMVISTNLPLRKDGEPRADARAPDDPGAAVYFVRNETRLCFACDRYDAVWKNLRAIQRTIEAMRGIERWGSSQLLERAFTGFAALPERTGPSCWEVLGLNPAAGEAEILKAWREKARGAHPDREGGSHEAMSALNEAKDIALATVKARTA
jgi:hypothetical protein